MEPTVPEPPPPATPPARNFVLFCLGSGISFAGTWAQKTGIGWMVWELTHSVAWVGVLALVDLIAALWVAPLAGTLIDRSSPRRLLSITEGAAMLLATALCLTTLYGGLNIHVLLLFVLAEGSLRGFSQPAQMLLPGLLAPPERLSQAVATSAITIALAISAGPAVAGLVMHGAGGVAPVFALNALSFLAMFAALFHLRRWVDRPPPARGTAFAEDVREGFRYVTRTPQIAGLFVLVLGFSFLARPLFVDLLPAFVGKVFEGGPGLLSMLMSLQGLGALSGAVLMLRRNGGRALMRILCAASLGICAALLVFVSTARPVLALGAIAAAGFCHVICNVSMQSLCQLYSECALRGRVLALYGLVFRTGPAISAFCIAQAGSRYPLGLLIGGCAAAYAVLVVAVLARRHGEWPPSASGPADLENTEQK
ncbi:MFS transporter [Pseudothauera rhizosphaerae]|uniref:MFS transporter n=1 Tax=Pseudothauera rhizosphaerae TaxID=2565932 RepID=A0A4S4ASC9_9RHOO|nr:MFS transporter [Pseudothauera rhizosphaerae]THF62730.1 MFS transporter [Pseudothauera rhizosphaerae]